MNSEAISTIEQLARDPPQDPEARLRLYNAATQLMTSVESPQTTAQRLFHGQMPLVMAQVGNDLRLFEKIASEPKKSWTVAELACATKADTVLLHRILRCLASYDMLCEQTDGTFSATNITFNLVCPGTDAGIKHYWKTTTKAVNAIPVCLANDEYQNRLHKTPFQIAYETDLHPFEWRKHNPEHAKAAQAWMAARMTNTDSVFDGRVPLDDFKLSPTELGDGQVLLVDVGGGSGHQCVDFRRKTGSQGHIVTQDLPLVRQMQTNLSELEALDIEPMVYDFMQPQPVKNAKIYYLRNVLHDWPDDKASVILSQIKEAMAPDSVLVIDDVVMPETGATWQQTSMDMLMMSMLAAMERSEGQFRQLLQPHGLQIRDVWTYDKTFGDSFVVAVSM